MINPDVVVIGSGMGGLSAAALLSKAGMKVCLLEQNWIPGGCTTSYWRKGFVFEAGATTLVGLDEGMPLHFLLKKVGIELSARRLALPMQVHLPDFTLNRHENISKWLKEVKSHFSGDQDGFWKEAMATSQFVWGASTRYTRFPPAKSADWLHMATQFRPSDLVRARYAFTRTSDRIKNYGIKDPLFSRFIDEQMMITAQNQAEEVNFLFGAAALCYTNYGNYYIDGGLINLVTPIVDFITKSGGSIHYRTPVTQISRQDDGYTVTTPKSSFQTKYVVSGIPINNTLQMVDFPVKKRFHSGLLNSEKVYSAFQMGIGFKSEKVFDTLHHQLILDRPLDSTGSNSLFVSLSHSEDTSRTDQACQRVASISTHIRDPKNTRIDKLKAEQEVVNLLEQKGFLRKEDIVYAHSATQSAWQKWTGREMGFVGGYPQFFNIKPWQMLESRLDERGAYLCGDTSYPGQGIPGATLSGIIAAEKLIADHF